MVLSEKARRSKMRVPVGMGRSDSGTAIGTGWGGEYARSSLRDDFKVGIRAVIKSQAGGHITEEQADALLGAMVAAYAGALIDRQVSDYLERGFSQMLSSQF